MRLRHLGAALFAALVVLIVVNAPPEDELAEPGGGAIPISEVFTLLEAENDTVRALWTEEIVGAGQERGLRFDADWREPEVEAGPLPALFLRETAESLRRNPVPLYLFLGSDFPINDANRFSGAQQRHFEEIRRTGEPQFFLDEDLGMHTAMFSDLAVAEACVTCHNGEPESARTDWTLGEVMGATTWSYPKSEVTTAEALTLVAALRAAFCDAYAEYLSAAENFGAPPAVGSEWPADAFALPSAEVFLAEAERRMSAGTLRRLLRSGPSGE